MEDFFGEPFEGDVAIRKKASKQVGTVSPNHLSMLKPDVDPPSAPPKMDSSDPVAETAEEKKASWFSDDRGNLKIVNHVVKRPWCSCGSVLVLCILMTVLLGIIVSGDGVLITNDENEYDLSDKRSVDYDSFRLAKKQVEQKRDATESASVISPRQSEALDIVYWIYEAETDGGVFTKEALQDIKEAEQIMLNHADWNKYCVLEHENPDGTTKPQSEVTCEKPVSPTTMFFPTSWDSALAKSVIDRLRVNANAELFNELAPCREVAEGDFPYGDDAFAAHCQQLLDAKSESELSSVLQLAEDIDTITSKWTGTGELVEDPKEVALFCAYLKMLPMVAFHVDFFLDKYFNAENPVSMFTRTVLSFGAPLEGYQRIAEKTSEQQKEIERWVMDNLYEDMQTVSTKSHSDKTNTFYFMSALIFDVFLSILQQDTLKAVFSVVLVFLYLWYMLGSLFLASVGMAEILFSLPCAWFLFRGIFQIGYFSGLNALTIFIVCAIGADDIFVFMDAYKQSAHQGPAVNRDLATRMSWVWRKSGTAMAITSATTCLAFLATLITPIAATRSFGIFAALVILWDYVLVMSLFCTAVVIYHNRFERKAACEIPFLCGCCTENCQCNNQDPSPTDQTLTSFHEGVDVPQDRVTQFFTKEVTNFVLSIKGRVLIALVLVAWLIPAIVYVTKLQPTKIEEQFLADDHPLQYSVTILNTEFTTSSQDDGLPVYFVWGVDSLDQSGVNQLFDPKFIGKPVFKDDFAFTPQCQRKLTDACNDLKFTRSANRTALLKQDGGFSIVECVMHTFRDFAVDRGYTAGSTDDTVPLENVDDAIKAYFAARQGGYEDSDRDANFGWDGEKLRFVSIQVESQALTEYSTFPEDATRAEYKAFVELAEHLDAMVGDACGASGVVMTDLEQSFVFMNNQKIYRQSAVQGSVIGVVIAFAVLGVATRSPLLAVLSTLSIIGTIVSVIGIVTMMGWTLGTVEAILISILAGFSVDYVVHLAHAYAQSKGSVDCRIRHAFGEMGTPVLSGMLTSVLASLPLFTCQIVFFAKFGTFLCFTILFSWAFANFGFMALLSTVASALASSKDDKPPNQKEGQEMTAGLGQAVFASPNPV